MSSHSPAVLLRSATESGFFTPPSFARKKSWGRIWANQAMPSLRSLGLFLAAVFVLLLILAAVWPSWLTAADPLAANAREAFHPPSLTHWMGTDENGRDLLTRIVYGARSSLLLGFGATVIGLILGTALGLLAGLGPRLLDAWVMRVVDLLMVLAFPDLLLALVLITFLGQGLFISMVAIGMASVPRYARLVRVQAQVVRQSPYVEAALTLGLHPLIVTWRHVVPNVTKPALVLATIGLGNQIAAGAALSFLGFGAPPPAPEWGGMLSVARNFLANAWWMTAFPALVITLTVLSSTMLGRTLMNHREGKNQ